MDLLSILATVILLTTIGTLVVAVAAYAAFKLRDKRKPGKSDPTLSVRNTSEPIFLTRYKPVKSTAVTPSVPPQGPT
jgi:heme/copper-type cytochrome/quinol oxidase subunit 2